MPMCKPGTSVDSSLARSSVLCPGSPTKVPYGVPGSPTQVAELDEGDGFDGAAALLGELAHQREDLGMGDDKLLEALPRHPEQDGVALGGHGGAGRVAGEKRNISE